MLTGLFFAAALAASQPSFAPKPVSEADKAEIKRAADKIMFDGPSARWDWPKRLHPDVYCGSVNGKNRLGAYVGWQPFLWTQNELRIIGPGDSRVVYEALCSSAGYIEKPTWMKRAN